jgi:hypothetical protein
VEVACAALSEGAGGGERRTLGEVRYVVIEEDAGHEFLAGGDAGLLEQALDVALGGSGR